MSAPLWILVGLAIGFPLGTLLGFQSAMFEIKREDDE